MIPGLRTVWPPCAHTGPAPHFLLTCSFAKLQRAGHSLPLAVRVLPFPVSLRKDQCSIALCILLKGSQQLSTSHHLGVDLWCHLLLQHRCPHPEHSAPSLLGSVILLCLEPTPSVLDVISSLSSSPSCWSPPGKQLDFLVDMWPAYCLLVPSILPSGGPLHSSSLPSTPFPMIYQPCPRIKNG